MVPQFGSKKVKPKIIYNQPYSTHDFFKLCGLDSKNVSSSPFASFLGAQRLYKSPY